MSDKKISRTFTDVNGRELTIPDYRITIGCAIPDQFQPDTIVQEKRNRNVKPLERKLDTLS